MKDMSKISFPDFLELTPAERIQLAQELWDSVGEIPEAIDLTEADKQELKRRLAEHRASPESAIPWDEVKRRIGL